MSFQKISTALGAGFACKKVAGPCFWLQCSKNVNAQPRFHSRHFGYPDYDTPDLVIRHHRSKRRMGRGIVIVPSLILQVLNISHPDERHSAGLKKI
jgi:hypothetical protein